MAGSKEHGAESKIKRPPLRNERCQTYTFDKKNFLTIFAIMIPSLKSFFCFIRIFRLAVKVGDIDYVDLTAVPHLSQSRTSAAILKYHFRTSNPDTEDR